MYPMWKGRSLTNISCSLPAFSKCQERYLDKIHAIILQHMSFAMPFFSPHISNHLFFTYRKPLWPHLGLQSDKKKKKKTNRKQSQPRGLTPDCALELPTELPTLRMPQHHPKLIGTKYWGGGGSKRGAWHQYIWCFLFSSSSYLKKVAINMRGDCRGRFLITGSS